jgi:hypothetical protein
MKTILTDEKEIIGILQVQLQKVYLVPYEADS